MPELQPGDHAPDFQTTDETGQSVSLSSLRGRVVILYFYPKDDTPGCTKQACAFRDAYAELTSSLHQTKRRSFATSQGLWWEPSRSFWVN